MREITIRSGVFVDLDREGVWHGRHFDFLPARTFRILKYLVEHANTVTPHEALLAVGWPDEPRDEQDLYRHIRRIRRIVEVNPSKPTQLITRKNRGYLLVIDKNLATSTPFTHTEII